ncbi:MAG: hypothetical protein M3367_15865, partial [Acidobacteriota bacterium]|nr:hypothetical protein [Acidobacteriota bacterium]
MEREREYPTQVESTNLSERRQSWAEGKLLPALFSVLLIALVLSPIIENWRAKPTDGFPLSHFPMFTSKRDETASVTHLVGLDENGNRYVIPHRFAGTGGMNQVRKQISKSARNEDAPKLCQTVAEKVAQRRSERYAKIVKVVVVSGEYNLDDYFAGAKNPVEEKIRVDCDVQRNAV